MRVNVTQHSYLTGNSDESATPTAAGICLMHHQPILAGGPADFAVKSLTATSFLRY